MNLLLDIHTLIWFLRGDNLLSKVARNEIEDERSQNFISIGAIWEITIKLSLGKIKLKGGLKNFLTIVEKNGFEILPISFPHLMVLSELEYFHRDPFDRLMVAQAISEKMYLVTKDEEFQNYECKTLW